VLTRSLSRDATTNEIVAIVTIANTGSAAALNIQLTSAKIASTLTTAVLPQPVSSPLPMGATTFTVVRFPPSAGSTGAVTSISLGGTYSGGSFSSTARVTLP